MTTSITNQDLLHAANQVRENAYAPYSKFRVGAAILGEDNEIHIGCNVESAVYGLTQCAERAAATSLIANGVKSFTKVAVVTDTGDFPCGPCRQFLAEFNIDAEVIVAATDSLANYKTSTLRELLPEAFTFPVEE